MLSCRHLVTKRLKFHIICLSDSVKLGASTKARRVILSAGPGPTPGRPDPVQACAASGLAGGGSNWVSSVVHCAITVQPVCTVRRASHQRAATTAASATAAAGKPAAPQRRRRAGLEDAKAGECTGPYAAERRGPPGPDAGACGAQPSPQRGWVGGRAVTGGARGGTATDAAETRTRDECGGEKGRMRRPPCEEASSHVCKEAGGRRPPCEGCVQRRRRTGRYARTRADK